jgi:hypothetical protein
MFQIMKKALADNPWDTNVPSKRATHDIRYCLLELNIFQHTLMNLSTQRLSHMYMHIDTTLTHIHVYAHFLYAYVCVSESVRIIFVSHKHAFVRESVMCIYILLSVNLQGAKGVKKCRGCTIMTTKLAQICTIKKV